MRRRARYRKALPSSGQCTAGETDRLLSLGDLGEHFGSESYPEKAARVLGEDRMPPLVGVRVRDGFDARPQQLVPQQGSVGHSI